MREYYLDIPTIVIAIIIYIYITKLSIEEYLVKKQIILILFIIQILGLIYDCFIILIGFSLPEYILLFFNKLRFIFHGLLVPLLILFTGNALQLEGGFYFINLITNIIISVYGIILGVICKLDIVENHVLKRYSFSNTEENFVKISFALINVGCVIYMIIVGIILYVKQREYYFFLSGFLMLFFSALGPIIGKSDLIYLLSMYGEILMIIFLYLFFKNKAKGKVSNKEMKRM